MKLILTTEPIEAKALYAVPVLLAASVALEALKLAVQLMLSFLFVLTYITALGTVVLCMARIARIAPTGVFWGYVPNRRYCYSPFQKARTVDGVQMTMSRGDHVANGRTGFEPAAVHAYENGLS